MPLKFKTFVSILITAYAVYILVLFSWNVKYTVSDDQEDQEEHGIKNKKSSSTDNTSIPSNLEKPSNKILKVPPELPLSLPRAMGSFSPPKVKKYRNRRKRRDKSFVEILQSNSRKKTTKVPSEIPESQKLLQEIISDQNAISSFSSQEETDIFLTPNSTANYTLEQKDPRILRILLKHYLLPPLPLEYNLKKPLMDPSWKLEQTKAVLELFKHKRNGIFIDVGAQDGEVLSNTLTLERDYGWRGILIEPDAQAFAALQTKRRRAWLANVCLSTTLRPEKIKILQRKEIPQWDRISKARNPHHKRGKTRQYQIEEVERKCFPFYSIISALNITTIDYLSLDVDSAEFEILKTIPFKSVPIRTLSLVFNTNTPDARTTPNNSKEFAKFLKDHGFTLFTEVKKINIDYFIYAHRSILKQMGF